MSDINYNSIGIMVNTQDGRAIMTNQNIADLHIHTNHSDGQLSPRDIVEMALDSGLGAIAITDHDNTSAMTEALEYANNTDLRVIPGIEISTKHNGRGLHMIGIFIDVGDKRIGDYVQQQKGVRREWALKSVARIKELGHDMSMEEVELHSASGMLGKNHIASALVLKGICKDIESAFSEFLGKDGKAYVPKDKIKAFEAIDLIKKAGGLAILAHPGDDKRADVVTAEAIDELVESGLDGIEVYSRHHDEEKTDRYLHVALDRGLMISGGSDFHRKENGKIGSTGLSEKDYGTLIANEPC